MEKMIERKLFAVILINFIIFQLIFAKNVGGISTYTAAVVEVNPVSCVFSKSEIHKHLDQAIRIITSSELDGVDIVVLPEIVFNLQNTAVRWPSTKRTFCDDPNVDCMLRNISCAVRKAKKYFVIDLYVKINCEEDDQSFCGNQYDKTNLYNMAIVFDRDGNVLTKYRKYHLFNEVGVQQTKHPEQISFKTDFNVTFGIGICFDLAFADPMIRLVEKGIENFVYTARWMSKMPYFTAVQYHQSWAYANNVNLLAANVNLPNEGCSGSGIFHGRAGALETFIDGYPTTKFLIAKVPINLPVNDINHAPIFKKSTRTAKLRKLKMLYNVKLEDTKQMIHYSQDNLIEFTVKFLNFSQNRKTDGKVCNNGICCTYTIEVNENGENTENLSYSYAVAVFSGQRSYDGLGHLLIGQDVCSVIACVGNTNSIDMCGQRIPQPLVHFRYKFIKLQLSTELPTTFKRVMANTLTHNLLPLNVAEYKISNVKKNDTHTVALNLNVPREDLLTFAILSRDYDRDVNIKQPH